MSVYDLLATDLAAIRSDAPTVLTHKGTAVTGVASAVRLSDEVSESGALSESGLSWTGCTADFATVPGVGEMVTVAGVRYWVSEKSKLGTTVVQLVLRRVKERAGGA